MMIEQEVLRCWFLLVIVVPLCSLDHGVDVYSDGTTAVYEDKHSIRHIYTACCLIPLDRNLGICPMKVAKFCEELSGGLF